MSLPTEAVTLAGSGLTFINSYDDSVSDAYRGAVIAAENFLQSHFTNPVTVSLTFTFSPLSATASAQNQFSTTSVSYATFAAALRSHATTADDALAVDGLPLTDPSNGADFAYVGTRTTGTEAGDYLISGPAWKGTVSQGMTQIASPHNVALVIGRVFVESDSDLPPAYGLAKQIQLTPLSQV